MPSDFAFDPITQDLIDDGKGGFVQTDTAATMVQHQLLCHFDEWWGDSTLGSRLHDPKVFQADPLNLGVDEAKRALGVIVTRGRIGNLSVDGDVPRPGRVDIATQFTDTSTGQVVAAYAKAGG